MDLFTSNLAFLLSATAFVIAVFSFFFFRAYLKRRTGQERILLEFRGEVNNILKSIDETADRDISLLEEKEKSLKSLLEEIERRHKVYIRDLEKYRDAGEAYSALQQKKPPAYAAPEQTPATYYELGKNRYRGNRFPPAEPSPPGGTQEEKNNAPANPEPGFKLPAFSVSSEADSSPSAEEQISALLRTGIAIPEIASRLGISIAEVEFAAALLERREN